MDGERSRRRRSRLASSRPNSQTVRAPFTSRRLGKRPRKDKTRLPAGLGARPAEADRVGMRTFYNGPATRTTTEREHGSGEVRSVRHRVPTLFPASSTAQGFRLASRKCSPPELTARCGDDGSGSLSASRLGIGRAPAVALLDRSPFRGRCDNQRDPMGAPEHTSQWKRASAITHSG